MAFTIRKNLRNAIYILLLLSPFILSEDPPTIDIENENTFELEERNTFRISLKNNSADYYKLTIKRESKINNINFILSYYQKDSKFKNRKQFSQGEDKVEMWLNKAQVDNEFFIELEAEKKLINFNKTMKINLDRYNYTELELEKQFNYYVSEENQMMKFKMNPVISGESIIPVDLNNYILTVWVKGNKYISSKLDGIYAERPSDLYNYYRINMTKFKENNYTFELTVNGTINDLINIGTLLFAVENDGEGEIYVTREILDTLDGLELAGYLKPNERVGFKYRKSLFKGPLGYFADINKNLQNLKYIGVKDLDTMETHQFTSSEELFYIIQLPPKTIFFNNFYINEPQLIGVNYFSMISENRRIGIIPMKLENFKFFTYEIIPLEGEIEVFIFDCEDYPSCSLNTSNKLSDYETFSLTFSKDDWDDEISPMSKKQKMLSISCKSKINSHYDYCAVSTIMRTDEDIIPTQLVYQNFINQEFPVTRYIKKGDTNVYKIEKNHDVYMNIEILSGDAQISTDSKINYKFVEGNKNLFKIEENKKVIIAIKASNNCVYRIIDYDNMLKNNYLLLGSSYLFNLNEKMNLRPYSYLEDRSLLPKKYYLGIYPIDNCNFEVESYEKNNNTDFYQFISNNLNNFYNITKSESSSTSPCRFYTSNYKLDNKMGISLEEYSNQTILFNKDNNEFYFSFAHVQKNKNVSINFVLDKNDTFIVNIKLNDIEYKIDEKINFDNPTIELKSSDIIDECENFNPICKIFISVKSNNEEETLLTIGINDDKENKDNEGNEEEENAEEEENGEEEEESHSPPKPIDDGNKGDDDDDKVLLIVLCCVGVILIVGIIIGIVLCRTKSENKNLADTVNKISFQDEDGRDTLLG